MSVMNQLHWVQCTPSSNHRCTRAKNLGDIYFQKLLVGGNYDVVKNSIRGPVFMGFVAFLFVFIKGVLFYTPPPCVNLLFQRIFQVKVRCRISTLIGHDATVLVSSNSKLKAVWKLQIWNRRKIIILRKYFCFEIPSLGKKSNSFH